MSARRGKFDQKVTRRRVRCAVDISSLYPSLMPKVFTHCSLFLDDNIHLNFDTMKQVKNRRFIFDETLCLQPQINQVIKTCYSRLRNLYRIGRMLDKDRKLQLVISYIFSCLDSCNILYYQLSKKLQTKLQVLLNDWVCFVYAKCRFCGREGVSVTKLAMELHILSFRFCILYKISLTIFKCIHGNAPDYLKDLIVLSQFQTGLHTSNCTNRLIPLPFLKYCKVSNAFRYSAPTVWNNLPPSIRSATSPSNFKSFFKALYFNLAYENV